jgi:hypothetical protein
MTIDKGSVVEVVPDFCSYRKDALKELIGQRFVVLDRRVDTIFIEGHKADLSRFKEVK